MASPASSRFPPAACSTRALTPTSSRPLNDNRSTPPAVATETVGKPGNVVHEVAQCLDERLVGHTEVLVAASSQHHGPVAVHAPGELGGKAGLAHARLPGQEGNAQAPGHRLLPQ